MNLDHTPPKVCTLTSHHGGFRDVIPHVPLQVIGDLISADVRGFGGVADKMAAAHVLQHLWVYGRCHPVMATITTLKNKTETVSNVVSQPQNSLQWSQAQTQCYGQDCLRCLFIMVICAS